MSNMEHVMTEKEMKDIWERLTAGEASIKSAHKRIDRIEQIAESVNELASSTKEIAAETKALREDYAKADKQIQELKDKPIKRYETFITAIITGIAGALLGYLLRL